MKLYVIRHAKAAGVFEYSSDSERPLVEKGLKQSQEIGMFFKAEQLSFDLVLASPVLRAKQTAEGLCEAMEGDSPVIVPWLSCGMRPEEAIAELRAYETLEAVAIVGHQPDLSFLIARLLDSAMPPFPVKKASVTMLDEVNLKSGRARFLDYKAF